MRFIKIVQNDFLKRRKNIISLSLFIPLILAKTEIELLVCYEKDYSYGDPERDGIKKYSKSLHMTFLQTSPALE